MSLGLPTMGEKSLDRIIRAIHDLACGRSNAAGSFSLATAGTTTTVTAPNCGENSFVGLSPMSSEAQLAGAYVSSVARGSFVVTHSASAYSRPFRYAIQG